MDPTLPAAAAYNIKLKLVEEDQGVSGLKEGVTTHDFTTPLPTRPQSSVKAHVPSGKKKKKERKNRLIMNDITSMLVQFCIKQASRALQMNDLLML